MIRLPKIFPVTSHTDFVGYGSIFVAVRGMKADGVDFIPLAIERGATMIVIEKQVVVDPSLEHCLHEKKVPMVRVDNARRALALLSAQAHNYPARKLKIIGITGTKGKTSSAFLLEHVLATAGYKTALLSTVYNTILGQQFSTQLTTQHPDYLHLFLNICVQFGVEYVVLESAAQAYTLDRLYGIEFDGFLFTNFDQEHAEFYPTMDAYFHAKASLVAQTKKEAPVIINADNVWCKKLLHNQSNYFSFGKLDGAIYHFASLSGSRDKTSFLIELNGMKTRVVLQLIGEFNSYNATGVFALAHRLGIPIETILQAYKTFERVPGRLERYMLPNGAVCYIDYAHNPASFRSVLSALRSLTDHLIVVCGAGGDRDKTKRPLMASIATEIADFVFFTSDNPRSEDPRAIIDDMLCGVKENALNTFAIELDREAAIKRAYALSRSGDVIALLGKGPDHYQIIGDTKIYFNEAEILLGLFG